MLTQFIGAMVCQDRASADKAALTIDQVVQQCLKGQLVKNRSKVVMKQQSSVVESHADRNTLSNKNMKQPKIKN